jgi:chemosensory pili system protein ChpA (sensor histidine kinase/response regulator)
MPATERVLVVEDDDDIREVIEQVLVSEGYRVELAKDGLDALDKLQGRPQPCVILLDMMMPNMDGEAFLSALRARPAFATVPVVVISGNAVARQRARELAAVACLVKPFELDELLCVVRSVAMAESVAPEA